MTTTPTLALEKQTHSAPIWDVQLNSNMDKIDNLASGVTPFARLKQTGVTGVTRAATPSGQTNFINNEFLPTSTGSVQQIGLSVEMTGIATGGANIFRIPLYLGAQTGGGAGANGVVGFNVVIQQNSADDVAFLNGLEMVVNNLKRNDPLNPVDQNHFGMTIDVYGGFSTGPAALAIRTGAANSTWQRGIFIPVNTITALGYAFDYEGNGSGPVRATAESIVLVGTSDVTNAVGGDLRLNKALWIGDGMTAPTQRAGFAAIYVDTADGDLKVKFGDGVTKTISVDT